MDASKQSHYGLTRTDTVGLNSVEIILRNSINNTFSLADGLGDRQTDMKKLIVAFVILGTHLKIEFSVKLSTWLPSSPPATTLGNF